MKTRTPHHSPPPHLTLHKMKALVALPHTHNVALHHTHIAALHHTHIVALLHTHIVALHHTHIVALHYTQLGLAIIVYLHRI
jgi:hypothetical protein